MLTEKQAKKELINETKKELMINLNTLCSSLLDYGYTSYSSMTLGELLDLRDDTYMMIEEAGL